MKTGKITLDLIINTEQYKDGLNKIVELLKDRNLSEEEKNKLSNILESMTYTTRCCTCNL